MQARVIDYHLLMHPHHTHPPSTYACLDFHNLVHSPKKSHTANEKSISTQDPLPKFIATLWSQSHPSSLISSTLLPRNLLQPLLPNIKTIIAIKITIKVHHLIFLKSRISSNTTHFSQPNTVKYTHFTQLHHPSANHQRNKPRDLLKYAKTHERIVMANIDTRLNWRIDFAPLSLWRPCMFT